MALSTKKVIFKNTGLLYIRTFIVLIVSLWTSRVILQSLGVEDYGVYSAVGGLVSLFSVLTGSMSAAISRYITYELGKENVDGLRRIFSTSIVVQLFFIVVVVIVAELLGLWFLNNKMTIPEDRMIAANVVYQCTIAIFCFNLLSVPYNAEVIAHEHMKTYAYISVIDNVFRLIIAYLIFVSPIDKLVFYSILMTILAISIRIFYQWYCKSHFEECKKVVFKIDKQNFSGLFQFAGWNILGEISTILSSHGIGVVLNVFLGPLINAAYGIASQVNAAVMAFSNNFTTALAPSITKSYAEGNKVYMRELIYLGARYSYYLLFIIVLPILIETPTILNIWLKEVPDYSITFVRLILLYSLITILSQTIIRGVQATGDIKKYQITISSVSLLSLPIAYICLRCGLIPSIALVVIVVVAIFTLIARLIIVKGMIGVGLLDFTKLVLIRVVLVSLVAPLFPLYLHNILHTNIISSLLVIAISVVCACLSCFLIGFTNKEKTNILRKVKTYNLKRK